MSILKKNCPELGERRRHLPESGGALFESRPRSTTPAHSSKHQDYEIMERSPPLNWMATVFVEDVEDLSRKPVAVVLLME